MVQDLDAAQRELAKRSLSALGLLSTFSLVGFAASLYLVNHAPLLLIALSPLGRHLVLVAPMVDPIAFMLVAVTRRMLFYLACFYLGRALGPAGIAWVEARSVAAGRFVRWIERLFARARYAVVLLLPGPTVSALAGAYRMRLGPYLVLAGLGLTARMLVLWQFADWLRAPIEELLAWIEHYWIPGTVLIVAGIAAHRWRRRTLFAAPWQ